MPSVSPGTIRRLQRGARRVVDRAVMSIVHGMMFLGDGASRPTMGNAPRTEVLAKGKLRLQRLVPLGDEEYELGHRVHPAHAPRHRTPLLVIPPLMVRPYVYDLRPEHSMLRTLRNAGFDVFVVDFGVPDDADQQVRLDDYVLDWIPSCVQRTLEVSGTSGLAVAGYCMGGLFGLLHTGTFRDDRVRALVTIGSPVDFEQMGVVTTAARLGAPGMDMALDLIGNIPGPLSSFGFKLLSGPRTFTRWADLLRNLSDEDYVRTFDAINTWTNDFIPYPREAFRQMFKEVVAGNKLLTNELTFGDRRCDLSAVRAPLLSFAGDQDSLAPPASTRKVVSLVGSEDKTFVEVPGGHVAVVAGSQAPERVWTPMVHWLSSRLD